MKLTVVTLRNDLRLTDNPALATAAKEGAVLPVFIWDESEYGEWLPGGASQWWLHHSLQALADDLKKRGLPLVIRKGKRLAIIKDIVQQLSADAVFWNRRYEPDAIELDKTIKQELEGMGVEVKSFNGSLLREPWESLKDDGTPYRVFTPYWKFRLRQGHKFEDYRLSKSLTPPKKKVDSLNVADLDLMPKIKWYEGMAAMWQPGEAGAKKRLKQFTDKASDYADERNTPSHQGTSMLSPHLHFGEISPRQIWTALSSSRSKGVKVYLSEVGWREFAHYMMYHFPHTTHKPMQEKFAKFPWVKKHKQFGDWCHGNTGFPIVDAGMRELWRTGWMHNRVRMIVASFLVKDMLVSWQEGARWFWDTLVDADLAANTMGWQWTAGCGADAAPYFRVFNPILQGEKFDKQGDYVRQWCPELEDLPNKWLHKPWEAPDDVLAEAGIKLGKDYPEPMVDHAEARDNALAAWDKIK